MTCPSALKIKVANLSASKRQPETRDPETSSLERKPLPCLTVDTVLARIRETLFSFAPQPNQSCFQQPPELLPFRVLR